MSVTNAWWKNEIPAAAAGTVYEKLKSPPPGVPGAPETGTTTTSDTGSTSTESPGYGLFGIDASERPTMNTADVPPDAPTSRICADSPTRNGPAAPSTGCIPPVPAD